MVLTSDNGQYATGETLRVPVYFGFGGNHSYTIDITAKFYDIDSGEYLGLAQRNFSIYVNNGSFCQTWVISYYQSAARSR